MPAATASVSVARSQKNMSSEIPSKNHGWLVASAGLGINLALGILYTWSLFKAAIEKDFGWKGSQLNDPYALCCLVFAFTMIVAGRCQDKLGQIGRAHV